MHETAQVFLLLCSVLLLLGQGCRSGLEKKKILTEQFYEVVVEKIYSQTKQMNRSFLLQEGCEVVSVVSHWL